MEENKMTAIHDDEELKDHAMIKVIGVGGGGSNAVNSMIQDKKDLIEYWVFNTDSQDLSHSPCSNKLVLGRNTTRGLGAGGRPSQGREAAEDSYDDIKRIVHGADMIFIAAGEGGGTGTGAAPIVAKAAKEEGCLVLGIVTRPFNFEGKARRTNALEGINALKEYVDALIVVSNDKLIFNKGEFIFDDAFKSVDEILAASVKTVTDLILVHGKINLDFADVETTLEEKGIALIGIGEGKGKNKAIDAAEAAINSPLLETSIRGSNTMIINFSIGDGVTLIDVETAINHITKQATGKENNDCNIIWGVQNDDSLKDGMRIAIIATDFNKELDFTATPTRNDFKANNRVVQSVSPASEEPTEPEAEAKKTEDNVLPDFLRHILKVDTLDTHAPVDEKKEIVEEEVEETVDEKPAVEETVVQDDDDEPTVITDRPDL